MPSLLIAENKPYWQPLPTVPGGLILHWSDPWGNGDLYETADRHWFLWKGSLGDYPKLGQPWATAISQTEARIWLRRARRRQSDRARRHWAREGEIEVPE